jgi:hypothetical protein
MSVITRSPFPTPIDPEYPIGSEAHAVPGAIYGYHRGFCCIADRERQPGQSVVHHGPRCESLTIGAPTRGLRVDGTPEELVVDLVAPYLHGVYDPDALREARSFGDAVRLTAGGDDDGLSILVTPSAARSLAAALIHAADRAEMLA